MSRVQSPVWVHRGNFVTLGLFLVDGEGRKENRWWRDHILFRDFRMSASGPDEGSSVAVWPNKKEDYELQDSIGIGATATVYKVTYTLELCCTIGLLFWERDFVKRKEDFFLILVSLDHARLVMFRVSVAFFGAFRWFIFATYYKFRCGEFPFKSSYVIMNRFVRKGSDYLWKRAFFESSYFVVFWMKMFLLIIFFLRRRWFSNLVLLSIPS